MANSRLQIAAVVVVVAATMTVGVIVTMTTTMTMMMTTMTIAGGAGAATMTTTAGTITATTMIITATIADRAATVRAYPEGLVVMTLMTLRNTQSAECNLLREPGPHLSNGGVQIRLILCVPKKHRPTSDAVAAFHV